MYKNKKKGKRRELLFNYENVKLFREAHINGYERVMDYIEDGGKVVNGATIGEIWTYAKEMGYNQLQWQKYMLRTINETKAALTEMLDDYYNEGFGYEGLDDSMKQLLLSGSGS